MSEHVEVKPKRDNSAALEKARAARAANIEARKNGTFVEPEKKNVVSQGASIEELSLSKYSLREVAAWKDFLVASIHVMGVKHPMHIDQCIPIADKCLELFIKKTLEKA